MRERIRLLLILMVFAVSTIACLPRDAGSDPVLVCIRSHESANLPNPWAAYNPAGPYYGAYQWLASSWDTATQAVGRPDLTGRHPIEPDVSRWDQDSVTLAYHHMVGDGPWGNLCG